MAKRKSLGKRLRFEVFKRDRFTCQYCGRTPPQVVLVIDHIVPVKDGGSNDATNLLTACHDCNAGKAAGSLTEVMPSLRQLQERQEEIAEQTEAYNRFLLDQRQREIDAAEQLNRVWCQRVRPGRKCSLNADSLGTVRRFLKYLAQAVVLDAMEIALDRFPPVGGEDARAFRYFCGICWKRVRGEANGTR